MNRVSGRWMAAACAAVLWVTMAGCAPGAPGDEPLESTQLDLANQTSTVTGSLSASGVSWVTHAIQLDAAGTLDVTLDWATASADLNVFFYDPSGAVMKSANTTTARPEVLHVEVPAAGAYKVGIKCKTGSTRYTLRTDFTPAFHDDVFTGSLSSSGTSWVTHTFSAAAGEQLDVTLDWATASADLNLFLTAPGASQATAFANGTTARPEQVSAVATVGGTWTVGIKCKTGASAYTLTVRHTAGAPVFTPAYPGQPKPGTVHWGASIGGNADPVTRHETPAGRALGVHRTFYQWNQRTSSLVSTAADDLAHGRVPWVSVKTPSWAEMGAGQHDAEIDQLLSALAALPGPVWLTIHHEPEGGGGVNQPDDPAGPAGHVAMNRRVRQRMTALNVDNVALAPILMSYTFKSASGRDPNAWFAPGIYDFIGIDHYMDKEASLLDATWASIRTWAGSKGLELAVGEWGMRGTDAAAGQREREWFEAAVGSATDGAGARVVGLSAFDSNLNSPNGGWELKGEQLTVFHQLMADPRAVLASP